MSDNKKDIKKYGKGSKRRKEDFKKILTNWDDIKGFGKSKFK